MPDDDGTILKCEGSNPRLPNSALEDSMVLNVMCKLKFYENVLCVLNFSQYLVPTCLINTISFSLFSKYIYL